MGMIWRENVRKLMKHYNMKPTNLAHLTGRSSSTLQHNFGPNARGFASQQTVRSIEKAFRVPIGGLSHPDFNPLTIVDIAEPSELAQQGHAEQLATLTLPIPPDKLERILRILNE